MKALVGIFLLAGVTFFAALSFHGIQTRTGLVVVPKEHLTLNDTYVDTRFWNGRDILNNRHIVYALEKAGEEDRIPQIAAMKAAKEDTRRVISNSASQAQHLLRKSQDVARDAASKAKQMFNNFRNRGN